MEENEYFAKQRIVQELVPGKQITLAHMIANPEESLFEQLNLKKPDGCHAAIGVMTVSPAETAIILADLAVKSSGVNLGFVDRIRGSLIITGEVSQVEAAQQAIIHYAEIKLHYEVCELTRT